MKLSSFFCRIFAHFNPIFFSAICTDRSKWRSKMYFWVVVSLSYSFAEKSEDMYSSIMTAFRSAVNVLYNTIFIIETYLKLLLHRPRMHSLYCGVHTLLYIWALLLDFVNMKSSHEFRNDPKYYYNHYDKHKSCV